MILITTSNTDTYNNPTILGILTILQKKDIPVKVISTTNYFKNSFSNVEHINLIPFNFKMNYKSILKECIKFIFFHLKISYLTLRFTPKIILGVDANGLILATKFYKLYYLFRFKKIPIDYLSFEIFFKEEGANKINEIEACKFIHRLVIQDSLRDKLLRTENNIDEKVHSYFIPVAPYLFNNSKKKVINFREKYKLSPQTKLIIFFGSFDNWSGAEWVLNLLKTNNVENIKFVIHSRYKLNVANETDHKLLELANKNSNIIISNDYIEDSETTIEFLKQFDAGFVFYIQSQSIYTGKNIFNIGLSSGKFSHLMAAGVPAITNNLPTYFELLKKYDFGYIINNEIELQKLLNEEINFSLKKENCIKLFDEILNPKIDLDRYVENLIMKF